jgi:hypothetical protein
VGLRPRAQPVAICVLLVMAIALSGCEAKIRGGTGPPPTQATFEALIRQDRAELMTGQLFYFAPQKVAVGTTSLLTVGLESAQSNKPVPPGQKRPHIMLKVGGVEGATLTAVAGNVTVSRIGPATGLIAQPGDQVVWRWDLSAHQPGPVVLDLVVVTYLGNTSEPLYTLSPPLAIRIPAVNTLGNQARSVGSDVASIAAVVGSVAGAIVAVAGVLAGIVSWRKRRKRRRPTAVRTEPDVMPAAEEAGDEGPVARPG